MPWFPLRGDARIALRCATENCAGQPTWRLEAANVGSVYCSGCHEKIESDPHWPELIDPDADRRKIRETIALTFDDAAQQRRFHARLNDEWLPIATAPKDGRDILVAFRDSSEACTGEFPEQSPQCWMMVVRFRGEDSDAGFPWRPPLDGSSVNASMAVGWMPLPNFPRQQ